MLLTVEQRHCPQAHFWKHNNIKILPFPPPKRYLRRSGRCTRNYVFSFDVQGLSNPWTLKQKHSFFPAIHFTSDYNTTQKQYEPPPPYPQWLCLVFPWIHPAWPQITALRLPMSPLQAPGGRVCTRCGWFPCLGCQHGTDPKIERWAEPCPYVASTWWVNTTTNRRLVTVKGER